MSNICLISIEKIQMKQYKHDALLITIAQHSERLRSLYCTKMFSLRDVHVHYGEQKRSDELFIVRFKYEKQNLKI